MNVDESINTGVVLCQCFAAQYLQLRFPRTDQQVETVFK